MTDARASRQTKSLHATNRNFRLVRGLWLLLAVLSLATFVMSVPIQFAQLQDICPQTQPSPTCDGFQLDPVGSATLHATGLSLESYGFIVSSARAVSEAICLFIAILIFWQSSKDRMATLVATMLLLANATLGSATLIWARLHPTLRVVDAFFLQAQPVTLLFFLFLFPDWRIVPRWASWLLVAGAATGVVYVLSDLGLSSGTFLDPTKNAIVEAVGGMIWISTVLVGMGSQIYRYLRVSNLVQREQTKWVVIGLTASLLISIPAGIPNRIVQPGSLLHVVFVVLNTLSFSLLAVALSIAIRRNRLWDIEVVVNRALIYGPLSAILAGIFAASVALINQFAKESLGAEATTPAAVISALIVASVFQPLRGRIERWINGRWYPETVDLRREFIEFTPEVRSVIGLKDLLSVIATKTVGLLGVQYAAILIADGEAGFRCMEAHPAGNHGIDQLKPDASLQTQLQKGHAVSKGSQQGLWVPLYLRRLRNHDVIGVLDVGPRRDGKGFSSDDKKGLSQLGAEIGTSIYTAQLREKAT